MGQVEIVNALAGISQTVALPDGTHPRGRNFADTPALLNAGDCPQVFFSIANDASGQIGFGPSAIAKGRHEYEVLVYFAESAENLGAIWQSRPIVAQYMSALGEAVRQNNNLWGTVTLAWVIQNSIGDFRYNGIPFRGGLMRVKAFEFV